MGKRGFSLVEVIVAMACMFIVLLAVSDLSKISFDSQTRSRGKFDGVEQRSDIRDLIFSSKNTAASGSCTAALGINPTHTFSPNTPFILDPTPFNNANSLSKITDMYLSDAIDAGTSGMNRLFATQLKINQKLTRGVASNLAPVSLGVVTVVVDNTNKIISCNWDADPSTNSCPNGSSSTCFMPPAQPTPYTTCPTGTSLSSTDGHCFPTDVDCYNRFLSKDFDGNLLTCQRLPAAYGIAYPSSYHPPTAPADVVSPTGATPTPTPVPATGPAIAATCACGSTIIPAGGSQKCIRGYNSSEGFGNYDDKWDVQVCNSAGQLQPDNPAHYFEEEGNGISFSWKVGYCGSPNGYTYISGVQFALADCY